MSRFGKRQKADDVISDGLILRGDSKFETEPRLFTLLMKGFIVYLVVMGSMGCLLSSFKIPYNAVIIHIAVLIAALCSAFLYYTKIWENIGYFVLFAFMLWTAVLLRKYISSGFFAVVNIISEKAAYYFDTEVVQGYAEAIGNRDITVTIAFVYVGWVHAILLNALISRQMKYFAVMFSSFFFLTVPFYLECEPDMLYILMLLAGCVIVFVFRGARHTPITKTNERFEYIPKKKFINYVYSVRHHATMIVIICVIVSVFGGFFQLFVNKQNFETTMRGKSDWKKATENTVENIYKNGIWGLFNRYESTGGLKGGVLGGVNSVSLDYETDLEVTYVPYNSERVYLRSFTGDNYLPVENRWERAKELQIEKQDNGNGTVTYQMVESPVQEETSSETAMLLKKRYDDGIKPSAKARMDVRNIAAGLGVYLPYYVYLTENPESFIMNYRQIYDFEFYPWLTDPGPIDAESGNDDTDKQLDDKSFDKMRGYMSQKVLSKYAEENYTRVPDENTGAIDAFISEAGLGKYRKKQNEGSTGKTALELVQALGEYYQQEIPYTYQPGATPRGTDFVNYFLGENRRGYCAHFASAATLIMRRLGYRARYIEGYAIDPSDLSEDARVRDDLNVHDYYEGDNLLSDEQRRVITVNVTDAMAHAWMEVETDGHWRICDITPWSEEDPPSGGFLRGLIDFLSGTSVDSSSSNEITDSGSGGLGLDSFGRTMGYGFLIIVGAGAVIFAIYILTGLVARRIRYARSGRNDRLVIDFGRLSRGSDAINYRERVEELREAGKLELTDEEAVRMVHILEKAGFSDAEISDEDDEWIRHRF